METLIFTFAIFLLAMAGLAIGAMAGRAPIKGSCGGLACIKNVDCGACGRRRQQEGADQ